MIDSRETAAHDRAELIRKSLKRHRLVFVQMGSTFQPLRERIYEKLDGTLTTVDNRHDWTLLAESSTTVVIQDLEICAESRQNILGEVREAVLALLDSGVMVCLTSRAPRIAFDSVPGSSVLEDAALVTLPLLTRSDIPDMGQTRPPAGWQWPSVSYGNPLATETILSVLSEIGQGLTASLDHALFEVDPKSSEGLKFLEPREIEGLRGSGLVVIDESGTSVLALRSSAKSLREALATHVSETVTPASILPEVTSGLWYIERKIRGSLRASAMQKDPQNWRTSSVGGLKDEVLRRAQLDTNVTAKSVNDLRDPLEWLTLGELLDIVRGSRFDYLGIEPAIWRKLHEQLLPVRNRLAHVRMLKPKDAELVSMWSSVINTRFGP